VPSSPSYYGSYLYFGAAILCEQDFADIFLPVAKVMFILKEYICLY
jgi:hypothetical protein